MGTEESKVISLINIVNACIKKHEDINKMNKQTFNIFSILRKESDEVNLHSKFIYELLKPYGIHQMGSAFLKLFLDEIKYSYDIESLESAKVYREYEDIDIFIAIGNKAIIIENKIYAEDQENQLNKYNMKIKKKGYNDSEIEIYYLTLDGHSPSEDSISGLNKKVNLISYGNEIINWLDKCKDVTTKVPQINEVLKQYYLLVKKLTGDELGSGFKMELVNDILLEEDNFIAALKIEEAMNGAKVEIMKRFWNALEEKLSPLMKERGFVVINEYNNYKKEADNYYNRGKSILGLTFLLKKLSEHVNLYFSIEVEENLYFGFFLGKDAEIKGEMVRNINGSDYAKEYLNNQLILDNTFQDKCSENWLGWKYYFENGEKINFKNFKSNNYNAIRLINKEQMRITVDSIYKEVEAALFFIK